MASKYGLANPLLTRLSIDRRNQATGYVADFASPVLQVNKSFGEYWVFDQGNNFQNPKNEKASGGISREITFQASQSSFSTNPYGSRAWYNQRELDDAGTEAELRVSKMNMVTDADMNAHEVRVATLVTTAASYASANKKTLSGNDQWSDFANSDPIKDVEVALDAIISGDAVEGNSMIVSRSTHSKLKQHPDITSRLQAQALPSGPGQITTASLGQIFGLDYRVASAQYNSADEGQTFSASYAWGNFALIFHKAPSIGKRQISLSYTFAYADFQMRSYFDEASKRTWIDNDHDVSSKLVAASVGYLLTNPIA